MKRPRSSILRMQVSVAMIAAALALVETGTNGKFWLGELTPLTAIAFIGLAITTVVVGLAFWVEPWSFRDFVLEKVIVPINEWLVLHLDLPSLEWVVFKPSQNQPFHLTRRPFHMPSTQAALGWLELGAGGVGGLVFALRNHRSTAPPINKTS